ncbi:hypothetical protein N7457_004189 [Penicillium paradoxum]|uniref:uncharacterized protein n=1 Tax=Penicillium paradoxum TaxID=176176 RepID=UPI002549777E|nr:uncharacterized protein N7457_004189 [Penicillium paradoxum]KAJ5782415.1 hypothetical protein N7457_004189 [Penicillium paradoxum]
MDSLTNSEHETESSDREYYCPRSRLVHCKGVPPLKEAEALIDRLYASGVPFFTKQTIQYAWDQIKREPARGEEIFLKHITGETAVCIAETGKVNEWGPDNNTMKKYICKELVLSYGCRASLRRDLEWSYTPNLWVACPISLMHVTYRRDSENKKIIPPRVARDREVVRTTFQTKTQEWSESAACERLKTILSSSAKNHGIDKVIGFALGTMSIQYYSKDGSPFAESGWGPASQHALLLTMKEWLQERDREQKVPCYSQDPAFTEVDRQILDEVGVEVIEDPRGWLEVDEQSMILSVGPDVPVKEIIADIARPAVIIWDRVGWDDGLEPGHWLSDPDSSRIRAMLEGYELHEFGPDSMVCLDLVVYIRKSVVAPTLGEDGRFL